MQRKRITKNCKTSNARHGSKQGKIIRTTGIVPSLVDGDVGERGGKGVESESGKTNTIEGAPSALGAQSHNSESSNENKVPEGINGIEVEAVNSGFVLHIA